MTCLWKTDDRDALPRRPSAALSFPFEAPTEIWDGHFSISVNGLELTFFIEESSASSSQQMQLILI